MKFPIMLGSHQPDLFSHLEFSFLSSRRAAGRPRVFAFERGQSTTSNRCLFLYKFADFGLHYLRVRFCMWFEPQLRWFHLNWGPMRGWRISQQLSTQLSFLVSMEFGFFAALQLTHKAGNIFVTHVHSQVLIVGIFFFGQNLQ